jgi:hypothetical protein
VGLGEVFFYKNVLINVILYVCRNKVYREYSIKFLLRFLLTYVIYCLWIVASCYHPNTDTEFLILPYMLIFVWGIEYIKLYLKLKENAE